MTSTTPPVLGQDPHRVREEALPSLPAAIGNELRRIRRQQGMTVADLATKTGLSMGMLSKIENGQVTPSLASLERLANALSIPITAFFRSYEERRPVTHVKAGDHVEVERRGTRAGHQYRLLGHLGATGSGVIVEPYLITLSHEADVFPTFQHEGVELIYMLEGEIVYRHGRQLYRLEPGDSLMFDADAPHGPEELVHLPARYISVIAYPAG